MPWPVKKLSLCLALLVLLLLGSTVGWAATPSSTNPSSYTVQSGDSLYSIAKKFGLTVDSIVQLNNISNPSLIKPGMKLILQAPVAPSPPVAAATAQQSITAVEPAIVEPKPVATYVVQAGDTFWGISRNTRVALADLLRINNLRENTILRPGQVLYLENAAAVATSATATNTSEKTAATVQTVTVPIVTPMGGVVLPVQVPVPTGLPGTTSTQQATDTATPTKQETTASGPIQQSATGASNATSNTVPHAISSNVDRAREALDRIADPTADMQWPVTGRLTSKFGSRWGRMHEGIDLAVPTGTPVRVAADGVVAFAGWSNGYGYLVKIDHGNGWMTCYAHNSEIRVAVDDTVLKGDVIARSGNTGNSTGPHLHFEIRKDGKALDPLRYLP